MQPRAPVRPVVLVMQPGDTMPVALARAQRDGNAARLVVPAIPTAEQWQHRAILEQADLLRRAAAWARI